MQRSRFFTAIIFSIAIVFTGFASAQAQSKKKVSPKGGGQKGQSPAPIGIQVAEPVDRDAAKVQVQSAGVRQVGLNVVADVRWAAVAPQGSRLESFDVEVIGDFGNNTGVSEKLSFSGTAASGQLFLAEAAAHPASEFRNINAKVIANFRDLNNNQLFTKASVKNFAVSVKPSAPVKPEVNLGNITVLSVVTAGLTTRVRWAVTLKPGTVVDRFTVSVVADLDDGQSVSRKELVKEVGDPNAREVSFIFAQVGAGGSPGLRIAKTKTVVNASVRTLANNSFDRLSAFREDIFPPPPLPVVNLAVSDLKTSLNNVVSVNWTINAESQVRIIEFQVKLATTFSNDTAIISEFKANLQARSFTRSFLPKDGPPNGFRQVFATITAKMEAPDGRRFDVVASRKLN